MNDEHLPGGLRMNVKVPLAEVQQPGMLARRWQALGQERVPHVRPVRILDVPGDGYFRSWVRELEIGDVSMSEQYSDAHEGVSGGPESAWDDSDDDVIVMHAVRTGTLRLSRPGQDVTVGPGMLCLRDVRVPWDFTYGNSTRARALNVPRSALAGALGTSPPQVTLVRQDAPEARLLDGHLDLLWTLAQSLPAASLPAARDAVLSLVSGVVAACGAPAADAPAQSVRRAARKYANEHLRDPGLGPPAIAGALGISVRALHRTFEDSGESLMAYIRRRRLECARAELMLPGRSRAISDVAARWQFSDASHFIRSFRRRYGETPGSVSGAF